jgi:hypothetical protein
VNNVFVSIDYGVTWRRPNSYTTTHAWGAIAMSSSGNYQTLCGTGGNGYGYLYTCSTSFTQGNTDLTTINLNTPLLANYSIDSTGTHTGCIGNITTINEFGPLSISSNIPAVMFGYGGANSIQKGVLLLLFNIGITNISVNPTTITSITINIGTTFTESDIFSSIVESSITLSTQSIKYYSVSHVYAKEFSDTGLYCSIHAVFTSGSCLYYIKPLINKIVRIA